jgi:Sulfatase
VWRLLTGGDAALVAGASLGLLAYLGHIASREYTFPGGITVFLMLVCIAATLALSTRYVLFAITVIGLFVAAVDAVDLAKLTFVQQHIHFSDLLALREIGLEGALELARQYFSFVQAQFLGVGLSLVVLLGTFLYEAVALRRWRSFAVPRSGLYIAGALAIGMTAIFFNSMYLSAVAAQNLVFQMGGTTPLRYSFLLAGLRQHVELSWELHNRSVRFQAKAESASCDNCPDIVVVHVESVFDPVITKEYEAGPGLMDRLGQKQPGRNGYLLVNTWGGFSWISEFELLCGVNHNAFGQAGKYIPITIASHATGCLPQHLKRLGYETSAIYPASGTWLNIRSAFKQYGIDTMHDLKDLGLPSMYGVRDKVLTDKLLETLRRPRTRPRFVWVSTNWNHGPHGADLPAHRERFAGPFDLALAAKSPKLVDYMNRLNDTYTNLEDIEARLLQMPFPIALLHYGDHQPNFEFDFTDEITRHFADRRRYVTYYRILANTGGRGAPWGEHDHVRHMATIEALAPIVLELAGIPLSPAMLTVNRTLKSCAGDYRRCSLRDLQALRQSIVR